MRNKKARDRVVAGLVGPVTSSSFGYVAPQARATAVAGRPFGDPSRLLSLARVKRNDIVTSL